ncbi:MAG: hypothetical protein ACOY94_25760 [Bacillota bacterium]
MTGISKSFLCELELGRKHVIHPDLLTRWVQALRVTSAFARGELPKIWEDPDFFRGMALDAFPDPYSIRRDLSSSVVVDQIARHYTGTIAKRSKKLPELVLAYILHLKLTTLQGIISGEACLPAGFLPNLAHLLGQQDDLFRASLPTSDPSEKRLPEVPVSEEPNPASRVGRKARRSSPGGI